MRTSTLFCAALALGGVVGIRPAAARPGARGEPAESGAEGSSRVDLSLRPSTLASVERRGRLTTLPRTRQEQLPPGQYVGPIWLDGVYAKHLKELPAQVRRAMACAVGPTVIKVESPPPGTTGAGGGLYARF